MRRPPVPRTLLLIAVIVGTVALVPAATGTLGAYGTITTENGTVGQLTLPDETAPSQQQTVQPELSSALASERVVVETAVATGAFERQFESASNSTARIDIIREELETVESRAEALRDTRNDAVGAFIQGDLTATELFRAFAEIEAAASGIEDRTATIETVTRQSDFSMPPALSVRLSSVDAELVSLRGPVLKRITAAARAEEPPIRVQMQTAENGLVLATIEGGTFSREGALWSARAETGTNQFAANGSSPLVATHERARAVYPWAFDHLVSNPSISGFGDSTIYPVRLNHAHGTLDAYFDGRTTDVFFERQRLRLSSLPRTTVATNETSSLSMRVNATGDGRPLSVTVTDPSTDSGVRATLAIENETVGTTDADGQLWILPVDDGEQLTATVDGTSVSVTVDD